jgi:hypothetical protein
MKDSDSQINKGVELMLRRRAKTEPHNRGFKINKIIALRNKVFQFKFEITWEESTT